MNIDDYLKKRFNKFIVRIEAGELLFNQKDAIKVLDEIGMLKAVILGLDFWQLRNDGDVLEINSTAWDNFNQGPEASKKTINAARELIGNTLPDDADYVSFVLKDQEVMKKK